MNELSSPLAEKTVCSAFAEVALRFGLDVALEYDGAALHYATLDTLSEKLAKALFTRGIARGLVVGIGAAPGPWRIVSLLAVLRAGAAYLPLPEGYSDVRLFAMLDAAKVRLVLGAFSGAQPLGIECEDPERLSDTPHHSGIPLPCPGPNDPAYVMFTSGSTGTPKGVVVPHRAVRRPVRGQEFMRFGPGKRVLQAAPLAFDAATLEIWGALLNGGTLVLPGSEALTLRGLGRVLAKRQITTLWLTAGLFHAMADERPEDFAPLTEVLTGGDVVSPARVARVLAACPTHTVINGYGPTENTTFTCTHRITAADLASGAPLPIGRAIAGGGRCMCSVPI